MREKLLDPTGTAERPWAGNAGVSAVVETFGARGGPPPVVHVRD